MALGGGTYITKNKSLPGVYINFISNATATTGLSDRGVVAMGIATGWGPSGEIFDIDMGDFQKDSLKILGWDYTADKLKGLRDLFKNCLTLHAYRLDGGGEKASCSLGSAKYAGTRGNDIKMVVVETADNTFKVSTYVGNTQVDIQEVATAADLLDNDFIEFDKTVTLTAVAGEYLVGGSDLEASATTHQNFLNLCESYSDINVIAYNGSDDAIASLYAAWTIRMRDEVGIKLQTVLYNSAKNNVAVINVFNSPDLVWWVAGKEAAAKVNTSTTNDIYDGEFDFVVDYTQKELEAAIKAGKYVIHRVGNEKRVLLDINSFVTTTETQGELFKDNQTIRIIDSIATSIANVFTSKYLGNVANNPDGRTSLWADVIAIYDELYALGAIEEFDSEEVIVSAGDDKGSVVITSTITAVNAMSKLYMETVVA